MKLSRVLGFFLVFMLSTSLLWAVPRKGSVAPQPTTLNLKSLLRASQVAALVSENRSVEKVENVEGSVSAIEVTGNKNIPTAIILGQISIQPGEPLDAYKINRNIKNIQSLGMFSEVHTIIPKTKKKKNRVLWFHVTENPVVQTVVFEGNTEFTQTQLMSKIQSKIGDPANINLIREDIRSIQAYFLENGYIEAKVVGVSSPEKEGDPLVFHISEGILEEIAITGNVRTQDYVIRREMTLKPGMVIKKEKLTEDLRRVYNLSYFQALTPDIEPGSTVEKIKLNLIVDEKQSFGAFNIGASYSPNNGLGFFSDISVDNLMGTGQSVMFRGQVGRATTFQAKYFNPWMWDERKSLTLRTWVTDGQLGSVTPLSGQQEFLPQNRKGADVSIGLPLSYEVKTSHTFKYERVHLYDANKNYRVESYAFGISYDTRDIVFNPTKGDFHSLSIEHGFKLEDLSLDFTRIDVSLHRYMSFVENQVLALRTDLGRIVSPQSSDSDIFGSEWYRVGGGTTVRGYDDQMPFAYGTSRVVTSAEYRFLFGDFQFITFIDAGFAPDQRNLYTGETIEYGQSPFNLTKYKIGKGVGIRYNLAMLGPLRLDAGVDELGTLRLHFNIGNSF